MDYLQIRELYHSLQIDEERKKFLSEFDIYNRDFLEDLPYPIRDALDSLRWRFKQEDWFLEAWEKYRQHVLEAGLGGAIKMPGYIFKPYLERYFDEHPERFGLLDNNSGECAYSDLDIGEYLEHHGIKGQKWGVRRWQEESGTLTPEGRERYKTSTGTKEVLKKSPNYGLMTTKQQLEYQHYAKKKGMKKGALIGAATGAVYGVTKRAINDVSVTNKKHPLFKKDAKNLKGFDPYGYDNGGQLARRYLNSAVWNGIKGAVLGGLIGRWVAGKKAKAELAEKGKEYTDQLLNEPTNRIKHNDILDDFLEHHGIKGQRKGVRRYQYEDGSLTPEGRIHYGIGVRKYQYDDGVLTAEGRKRFNKGLYDENDPDAQRKWEKENVYAKNGKYYYDAPRESDGYIIIEPKLYKTSLKDLDDKEVKELQTRLENETKLMNYERDIKAQEKADAKAAYDKGLKEATAGAKDTKDVLDSSARVLDATARALPTGNGHYVKKDYSNISDQELRDRISRLQLEESYGRLSGDTKYVKSGSEKTREILQTAGAIVAIGASAASLAAVIAEIKYKKNNKE